MTQWHIYVDGKEQPGLISIDGEITPGESQRAAVKAWIDKNLEGQRPLDGQVIHAQAHIPFNPRTRRNVSRSPAPAAAGGQPVPAPDGDEEDE